MQRSQLIISSYQETLYFRGQDMNPSKSEFCGLSFRNCILNCVLTSDDLLCSNSRTTMTQTLIT